MLIWSHWILESRLHGRRLLNKFKTRLKSARRRIAGVNIIKLLEDSLCKLWSGCSSVSYWVISTSCWMLSNNSRICTNAKLHKVECWCYTETWAVTSSRGHWKTKVACLTVWRHSATCSLLTITYGRCPDECSPVSVDCAISTLMTTRSARFTSQRLKRCPTCVTCELSPSLSDSCWWWYFHRTVTRFEASIFAVFRRISDEHWDKYWNACNCCYLS